MSDRPLAAARDVPVARHEQAPRSAPWVRPTRSGTPGPAGGGVPSIVHKPHAAGASAGVRRTAAYGGCVAARPLPAGVAVAPMRGASRLVRCRPVSQWRLCGVRRGSCAAGRCRTGAYAGCVAARPLPAAALPPSSGTARARTRAPDTRSARPTRRSAQGSGTTARPGRGRGQTAGPYRLPALGAGPPDVVWCRSLGGESVTPCQAGGRPDTRIVG